MMLHNQEANESHVSFSAVDIQTNADAKISSCTKFPCQDGDPIDGDGPSRKQVLKQTEHYPLSA